MASLDNRGFNNIQITTTSNDSENISLVFNKVMSKLRILSCVMIAVGSVLIFVGIVIVANIGSHIMFPFPSGSQIWSEFVMLMQGILGFRVTTFKVDRISDIVLRPFKYYFRAFYGFLVTSFTTNAINLIYSIIGFSICSEKTCADNNTLMMVMLIFVAILAVCAFICTFFGFFLICKYRRCFGFAPKAPKGRNIYI